jgi:hypothetical protein
MISSLKKYIPALVAAYVFFGVGLLYWAVIYSGSGDGDTLEHVHSSWLVYHGQIPYKDFFQHHNPLLWYIAAPFVGAFEYSLRAVDAVNILTVTLTGVTTFFIFRINKDFLTDKLSGLVAAAFFILPHESLFNKDFKPDNVMATMLIVGIYYLLSYIKNKKIVPLVFSFLFLFAAFMITQKAALTLLIIGGIGLWLIYEKELVLKDCLICATLPIMLYAAFLAFLWYEGVFEFYFKANFELNSHIPDIFDVRQFVSPSLEMMVPLLFAIYALAKCTYKGNVYVKTVSMIFIGEYLIRLFYFTPFLYYYIFLHAIASTLAGVGVHEIISRKKNIIWIFVIYFFTLGGIYANLYSHRITVGDSYKYGASGFVLQYVNRCDYVLNGYRIGYNLFNKDVDFVWNLKGQIDVIADMIKLYPLSDLESLIRKYRPKIIYGGNYYDTYQEYHGHIGQYPIHWISQHLLDEMYQPLNRDDLYILKPEYRRQDHDCIYNAKTKLYEYRKID